MADIDLTFIELINENETESTPAIDAKKIEPQFTEGVKEFYVNLGKTTPKAEKMALLEGVETDFLFDELRRRFTDLNLIIEGITSIVLNSEPVDVSPQRIEALRRDFKQAEKLRDKFKEIINK